MSPVLRPPRGRQYTAKKGAAVKRLEAWRSSGLQLRECEKATSLIARERAEPASVWPPRPRLRWRVPKMSPTARLFVDLVQEREEFGAQGLIMAHDEFAALSGRKKRMCEYAVAQALALGVVEQVPVFSELDESQPMPEWLKRATRKLKHAEKTPAYRLGPLAVLELQREHDRKHLPPGHAEREISAEARKLAARNHRFSPRNKLRSNARVSRPEEATEEAQTPVDSAADAGCAVESVSPAATRSTLNKCPPSRPTPTAPPLELRNSWTREAATPPPRKAGSAATRPAATSQTPVEARTRPAEASAAPSEGADGAALADLLSRLRLRFCDPDGDG